MQDAIIARVRMLYTLGILELDFEVLEDIRRVFSDYERDEERVDRLVKTMSNSSYYASLELLELRTLYLYVSTWKEYKYLEKYDCFNDLTLYKVTNKLPTYVYTYYGINNYSLEYEVYAYEKSLVGLEHEKVQEYTTYKNILEELS